MNTATFPHWSAKSVNLRRRRGATLLT